MKGVNIKTIDVETTGLTEPKITQFGICSVKLGDNKIKLFDTAEHLVDPKKLIEYGAMGLTGITNEMVKGKPLIEDVLSHPSTSLKGADYVVAHNLSFDKRVIDDSHPKYLGDFVSSGGRLLCTLKLSKLLIDKNECGDHKNVTLFYYLGCHLDSINSYKGNTHTAGYDAWITMNVLLKLLSKFELTIDQAWELLYDVKKVKFGKYKDHLWEDVVKSDYSYLEYCVSEYEFDEDELSYLKELLTKFETLKLEQVKVCSKKKYEGVLWEVVVKENPSYVDFLISNNHLRGEELEYVKSLM